MYEIRLKARLICQIRVVDLIHWDGGDNISFETAAFAFATNQLLADEEATALASQLLTETEVQHVAHLCVGDMRLQVRDWLECEPNVNLDYRDYTPP